MAVAAGKMDAFWMDIHSKCEPFTKVDFHVCQQDGSRVTLAPITDPWQVILLFAFG